MSVALEIARIPDGIKGFGHVKDKNIAAARVRWGGLMNQLV
jgi:indolepyruvate ferredoxin oxidoreductase